MPRQYDTFYAENRTVWRQWLNDNFEKEKEIWLIFPLKESGEVSVSYNDAVEEALCFGWIDSTYRSLDDMHGIRRFSARRKGSSYSRANIERLIWLYEHDMIHPTVIGDVIDLINEPYVFPDDIIEELRKDEIVWNNYSRFSDSYKRIRIAYIDAARNRPSEFRKRLDSFISKTRENKVITGYGGIEKYYGLNTKDKN